VGTLTEKDMFTWQIRYPDGTYATPVQASYSCTDPDATGVITLKDWQHQVVAMLPPGSSVIRRPADGDDTGPPPGFQPTSVIYPGGAVIETWTTGAAG
jgi:hypothetical protein